jgi:uncharacterized protein (TIGR03083 family)
LSRSLTDRAARATLVSMDAHDLLVRLRAESAHIAAFAADRDLDAPVPPCPGMTAGAVIQHLGSVHRRVTGWVRDQSPPDTWEREPRDGDVVSWFHEGAAELYDELARHDPDAACATWSPDDHTAAFWWRRMAHETAVHRVDVELAYGPAGPIGEAFAADGVDEVLTLYLAHRLAGGMPGWRPKTAYAGSGEVVGVSAGRRLWRVALLPEAPEVTQELPDDADAVVIGEPDAVYLWLWGRRGDDAIRVCGDPAAAAALRAALAVATT